MIRRLTSIRRLPTALVLATVTLLAGCDDDDPAGPDTDRPFYQGTEDDPQIGLVVNSLSNALRLFQVGDPSRSQEIALGASSAVTPTGVSVGAGVEASGGFPSGAGGLPRYALILPAGALYFTREKT